MADIAEDHFLKNQKCSRNCTEKVYGRLIHLSHSLTMIIQTRLMQRHHLNRDTVRDQTFSQHDNLDKWNKAMCVRLDKYHQLRIGYDMNDNGQKHQGLVYWTSFFHTCMKSLLYSRAIKIKKTQNCENSIIDEIKYIINNINSSNHENERP